MSPPPSFFAPMTREADTVPPSLEKEVQLVEKSKLRSEVAVLR